MNNIDIKIKTMSFKNILKTIGIFLILALLNSCNSKKIITDMNEPDSILIRLIEKNKTPSLQYIIFDKDSIIHRFHSGFADIKRQKKADEFTTYHAYSVTKTFTALAILQLAEKGDLDINHSVNKYYPNFPYSSDITVRQLLTHTAGIPNPLPLSWIHLTSEHQSFDSKSFFKNIFIRNNKVKSEPNEKFRYSNLGYVLLGQLIEEVTGMTCEKYIQDHILKIIHDQSHELGFTIDNPKQHAKGYHKQMSASNLLLGLLINKRKYMDKAEGKWKPFKNFYINGAAYGGLIGTPDAFMKYIRELLKSDCRLISEDYKKMLFTENHTKDNEATGMCLSWFKGQMNGNLYFAHAGGGGGYYCELRIYPDLGIGSVIMFNRTGMRNERFLDKVDSLYLESDN